MFAKCARFVSFREPSGAAPYTRFALSSLEREFTATWDGQDRHPHGFCFGTLKVTSDVLMDYSHLRAQRAGFRPSRAGAWLEI